MVEGSPFPDMFSLAGLGNGSVDESGSSEANSGVEGKSPRNPIVLEQTKAAHFRAFLRALYPL